MTREEADNILGELREIRDRCMSKPDTDVREEVAQLACLLSGVVGILREHAYQAERPSGQGGAA